jgi:hypothetical protein
MVPAAVISIGNSFGLRSAASSAALYPAMVAWEERASIDCARVIRGMDSIANATTPRSRSRSTPAASVNGCRKPMRIVPERSESASSALGVATRTTPSAPSRRCAWSARAAPAFA